MNQKPQAALEITSCRGCQNAVSDPVSMARALQAVAEQCDFSSRLLELHGGKVLHHLVLRVVAAGCPNACPQPQIKDFGLIGRSSPAAGEADCIACGLCVEACPDLAVVLPEEADDIRPIIDPDLCVRCARCARACPTGALIAETPGFEVMIGGRVGRHPKFATSLAACAGSDEAVRIFAEVVERYLSEAQSGERFAHWFDRTGGNAYAEKACTEAGRKD